MSGNGLMLLIVGLIAGGAIGYFIARFRSKDSDHEAELAKLQKEFDDYQAKVRGHFIETVSAIGRIDQEQKRLYESVAEGVTGLCRPVDGEDDYFLEQTMQTLGQLEPPKKKNKNDQSAFD